MNDQQMPHPSILCKGTCANSSPCLNYADKDGYCWRHHDNTDKNPCSPGTNHGES